MTLALAHYGPFTAKISMHKPQKHSLDGRKVKSVVRRIKLNDRGTVLDI